MNLTAKLILIAAMTAALFFGFLHLFFPIYNFERLHIFLFNLCSGGTVILIYSEGRKGLSARTGLFFILSFAYAIFAFLQLYPYAVSIALLLALLVETVRIKKFSFLPRNFFRLSAANSEKFHHASLLCLSLGLVISALVICNNQYWRLVSSPKLTLDIFFLGFSFPVSLITMSVMYDKMKKGRGRSIRLFENASFWIINIGVILFFLFILTGSFLPELIIAGLLFATVVAIFIIYLNLGFREQPKPFLASGMAFLIMTAVTGIIYMPLSLLLPGTPDGKIILKLHAIISLYGWNLSGLTVICRNDDFPIKLRSARLLISLHWTIVLILAPLGFYYRPFAIIAMAAYVLFLSMIMFSQGAGKQKILAS
jgi:hypothetical protein